MSTLVDMEFDWSVAPKQTPSSQTKESFGSTKWNTLALLAVMGCLSSVDRIAMSMAMQPMMNDLWIDNDVLKGTIASSFSVGYGVALVPAGLMAAAASSNGPWSTKHLMAAGLFVWSVATMLTPWAALECANESLVATSTPDLSVLLAVRACVGMGESVALPCINKMVANWCSAHEKSTIIAGIMAAMQLGQVVAYLVSPLLLDAAAPSGHEWCLLFQVYGGMGLLLLLPWLVLARDGPELKSTPRVADNVQLAASVAFASSSQSSNLFLREFESSKRSVLPALPFGTTLEEPRIIAQSDAPWAALFQSSSVRAMCLTHCARNWGLYTILAWTPIFFMEHYHVSMADSAWLSVGPSVVGMSAGLGAGRLVDWVLPQIQARHDEHDSSRDVVDDLSMARKVAQTMALAGPAVVLTSMALEIPNDPIRAAQLFMLMAALQACGNAGNDASVQDKPQKWTGLLYSVTALPAVLVGSVSVYLTGQVLDWTHQDWSFVFGLNACVNVLGALTYAKWYNAKREFD
jgi:MFS transporter, ACS family, solute carrier family 17 (sodium-dependent inorganic phosphate cotransporter), other